MITLAFIAGFWVWGLVCFLLGVWATEHWREHHDHNLYAAGFEEGHSWGRLTGFLEGSEDALGEVDDHKDQHDDTEHD